MPGCFLDKIGHRCFHVRECPVTSGSTSAFLFVVLLCAVRMALLIHLIMFFFFFSHMNGG